MSKDDRGTISLGETEENEMNEVTEPEDPISEPVENEGDVENGGGR